MEIVISRARYIETSLYILIIYIIQTCATVATVPMADQLICCRLGDEYRALMCARSHIYSWARDERPPRPQPSMQLATTYNAIRYNIIIYTSKSLVDFESHRTGPVVAAVPFYRRTNFDMQQRAVNWSVPRSIRSFRGETRAHSDTAIGRARDDLRAEIYTKYFNKIYLGVGQSSLGSMYRNTDIGGIGDWRATSDPSVFDLIWFVLFFYFPCGMAPMNRWNSASLWHNEYEYSATETVNTVSNLNDIQTCDVRIWLLLPDSASFMNIFAVRQRVQCSFPVITPHCI